MKRTFLFIAFALMGLSANIANAQTIIASGDCGASGNNLTWVLTDDSVLTISGSGAMADYEFYYNDSPWFSNSDKIKTLVIGNSVTTIGNYAFVNCDGLSGTLTIPNSVTTIGERAFSGCYGLSGALTIPNSVTTIGRYAFFYCSGLSGALTIPNSVTTIGDAAFWECGLTSLTCNAVVPPSLGTNVFNNLSNIPVYVPCYSLNAYQASWTYFNNFQALPIGTTIINASICNGTTYTANGFTATTTGEYSRTEQNANGCDSTITLNLSVFAVVDTAFINATITEGETYADNGFNESTAGTYQLILQNANGCDSVIVLNLSVNGNGLVDVEAADFNIYPNPASNRINFSCSETIKEIEVFNIVGQQVYVAKVNEKFTALNVACFAKGSYITKLRTDKGVVTKKFVLE